MATTQTVLGRVPTYAGPWDSNYVNPKTGHNGYPEKKRVTLYGSEFQSKLEDNTYAPATLNAAGTQITFDTTHWDIISNGTDAYLLSNQTAATLTQIETEQEAQRGLMETMVSNVAYDTSNKKITKTINNSTTDVVTVATLKTDFNLTKSDVGLGNVTNEAQIPATEKGAANGVATLDASGLVPSDQLPSYVDDIVELLNITDTAPATCSKGDWYFNTTTSKLYKATAANTWGVTAYNPEKSKIYFNKTNELSYRWGGSSMIEIITSEVTGVKVGSSGSVINPSQGVITLPAYETNADVTDAENVKAALGTVTTSEGKYLKDDGTWAIPDKSDKADKDTDAVEDNVAVFDTNGNPVDSGTAIDDVALKEGYYPDLHSGLTDNLFGSTQTNDVFTFRPTAGIQDVESGDAPVGGGTIKKVEGNAVAWNQLMENGDFSSSDTSDIGYVGVSIMSIENGILSFTTTTNFCGIIEKTPCVPYHKYYIKASVLNEDAEVFGATSQISNLAQFTAQRSSVQGNVYTYEYLCTAENIADYHFFLGGWSVKTYQTTGYNIIDLTILGIDNLTTVAEVEQWLDNNIGLKDYYPYNAGELISVKDFKVKSVGFNQWDEEYTLTGLKADGTIDSGSDYLTSKNFIAVKPNTTYYFMLSGKSRYSSNLGMKIVQYGKDKLHVGTNISKYYNDIPFKFTTDSDCYYIKFNFNNYYGTTYNHDICINLSYDGDRDGEYEEYWERTVTLDPTKLYGKLNGTGDYVQVFPDGMKKAGTVKDVLYLKNGVANKNVDSVDLGVLAWYDNGDSVFKAYLQDAQYGVNLNCAIYVTTSHVPQEKEIYFNDSYYGANNLAIKDSSYTDATTFAAAMSGVMLYYQLATPLTYTDLIYRDNGVDTPVSELKYRVDNYGTEEVLLGNDESIVSSSPKMTINYGINAADTIADLPHSYVSVLPQQLDEDKQKQARQNINAASQDSIIRIQEQLDAINPKVDNDYYVDMGLPSGLLWAKRNIDVTQPDGFAASEYSYDASYFSWGNVEGHNPDNGTFDYSFDATTYASTPGAKLTGNISLSYDAARAALGAPWRMPSADEFQELFDNCDFIDANGDLIASTQANKLVTMSGVVGIRLKSKNNGGILFLPCCGYGINAEASTIGVGGDYWSMSLSSTTEGSAIYFFSYAVYKNKAFDKFYGFTIRPVM